MNKTLRIIDANFNRAREGLRVIEDGVRFYYDGNETHIKQIKAIRHSLAAAVEKNFGLIKIKRERNTLRDTGKDIDTRTMESTSKIIEKNFLRVSEALRAMEEYSKTINPAVSSVFHNLRFRLYSTEQNISLYIHRDKIPSPFLSVLLTTKGAISLSIVEKIARTMPDILILRFEGEDDRSFLSIAKKIKNIVPPKVKLLIQGRADICLLCNADGVFLEKKDVPHNQVKELLQGRIILTKDTKTINIPVVSKTYNFKSHLKELRTKNIKGIILIAGDNTPDNIGTIVKTVKKEVSIYVRERKEKSTGKK